MLRTSFHERLFCFETLHLISTSHNIDQNAGKYSDIDVRFFKPYHRRYAVIVFFTCMKALVFHHPGESLLFQDVPRPVPHSGELLINVRACGVCRTDLHIIDGELAEPVLPLIPGHQIVGTVVETGREVGNFSVGDRVGVPWLGGTCGSCCFCSTGRENLCVQAVFTGYQRNGGFAEYAVADSKFCF